MKELSIARRKGHQGGLNPGAFLFAHECVQRMRGSRVAGEGPGRHAESPLPAGRSDRVGDDMTRDPSDEGPERSWIPRPPVSERLEGPNESLLRDLFRSARIPKGPEGHYVYTGAQPLDLIGAELSLVVCHRS